jgi:GR25 family glycosyltransferase involved in LPS biosynthesis
MKAFIIRLKENKLSCKIAEECVQQAQTFGTKIEYFDGIYGNIGLEIFKKYNVKKFDRKVKEITPGIVGCAASHYLLWKKCVELDETLLILEQDGYQIRPLPADIEDNFTDIIKLDNCRPSLDGYERCVRQDHETKYMDYQWPDWIVNNLRPKKIRRIPYGYPYFNGAWSYMIKPAGASKVCRAFETQGWVPADKALGSDIMSLKTTQETIFRLHPRYTPKKIKDLSLTRNL